MNCKYIKNILGIFILFFILAFPVQVQAAKGENLINESYETVNRELPKGARVSYDGTAVEPSYGASASSSTDNISDLKDIIESKMYNRTTQFSVYYDGDTSDLGSEIISAISDILNGDDYLYYSYTGYKISISGYENDVTIDFRFGYLTTKSQENFVDSKVTSILGEIIDSSMNNHEKEKAIHDYIVKNVEYDTSLERYSAYNALSEGKTVCQGYALLAYKMLTEAGVESKIIAGSAGSGSDSEGHAWNLVKLDGKWYHLDCTWDDPIPDVKGRVLYDYYNLTDSQISQDHNWDTSAYPAAVTVYKYPSEGVTIDFSKYKKWGNQSNISKNKMWSIKFTKPFDASTVNSNNVLVYEEYDDLLYPVEDIEVTYNNDKDTVYVKPSGEYDGGKTYYLVITQNVLSEDGKAIPKPIVLIFKIQG
ncbi:transglutaminase domain-containing protein [Clostridium kluyveri]|uniref:transglutaminase domain-containing protein n=1 Tax=Clostridium kluyveri TaxID=1534 RepID=UPI0022457A2D|nr:transglutaminase domain-containing protein [Clostridium kluyveri]UZQ49419.1 Ig-like domain-containing protein [Clostridium kluyveri]